MLSRIVSGSYVEKAGWSWCQSCLQMLELKELPKGRLDCRFGSSCIAGGGLQYLSVSCRLCFYRTWGVRLLGSSSGVGAV